MRALTIFGFATILLVSVKLENQENCLINKGKTPNFESIFIGKCNFFINVVEKSNCKLQERNISCETMWKEFSKAFLNREPCQITADLFKPLFEISQYPIGHDKSLFWSGCKVIAQHGMLNVYYIIKRNNSKLFLFYKKFQKFWVTIPSKKH